MQDIHYYSIPLGWECRRLHLAMAERDGLGVEIEAFASGPVLGDRAMRRSMESALLRDLSGIGRARSYHGVFIDLSLHSEDPWIAQVTRDRMEQDMETASMLGATTVVFHTGFNPLVPVSRYRTEFLNRQGSYWPRLADAWPNRIICLENLWELIELSPFMDRPVSSFLSSCPSLASQPFPYST